MSCLILGPIISFIVSPLKNIPWVKNNPKTLALILSAAYNAAVAAWSVVHNGQSFDPGSLGAILTCVLTSFGVSVATHEVVTQPLSDMLVKPDSGAV